MGVKSPDGLLAMSPSQLCHIDIAEMNLLCATGLPGAENLDVRRCLTNLDAWARWVRHETDRHLYRFRRAPDEFNHSEGYFRMLMLVTVLQQDFGVRYNPDRIGGIDFRDSRDLFIHGLLEEPHTGTCASMPVLYVAAGRRLGYPLRLVLTHGHVFVRWDSPDGRERFNIECASRGMLSFPDEYYKTWPTPLTDRQVTKGRYLISLGAAEELAVFMESRGHCLLDNGRIREARMAYEHACRLDPLSPGHWSWLDDALVREASLVPHGGNLNTFSNWGCSMATSRLPTPNSILSIEPVRTFRLDSTRYRNYHPTLGRWVQRDPIPYVDGANLYQYACGNPVTASDPQGEYVSASLARDEIFLNVGLILWSEKNAYFDERLNIQSALDRGLSKLEQANPYKVCYLKTNKLYPIRWRADVQLASGQPDRKKTKDTFHHVQVKDNPVFLGLLGKQNSFSPSIDPHNNVGGWGNWTYQMGVWTNTGAEAAYQEWWAAHEILHFAGLNDLYDWLTGEPDPNYVKTLPSGVRQVLNIMAGNGNRPNAIVSYNIDPWQMVIILKDRLREALGWIYTVDYKLVK
jgi:hypothetical protein